MLRNKPRIKRLVYCQHQDIVLEPAVWVARTGTHLNTFKSTESHRIPWGSEVSKNKDLKQNKQTKIPSKQKAISQNSNYSPMGDKGGGNKSLEASKVKEHRRGWTAASAHFRSHSKGFPSTRKKKA